MKDIAEQVSYIYVQTDHQRGLLYRNLLMLIRFPPQVSVFRALSLVSSLPSMWMLPLALVKQGDQLPRVSAPPPLDHVRGLHF
ncbi:uncharacterized protein BT62DRAFT_619116 [Guyanagaster necrorhizus]|uniref:Uncharacterized protein n=1 Tax=Guyanagaster necrorhizus TaxID=856835 RepID=A0A9P8AVY0_9AGAR|nr:uncharacterized protein BT62DRAFT_619116 [Guyanagaster necrorhizus MCA 3950]KAG7450003.1 hypothetical protein BT62DRAFT_619116 [Guyanagaster necrorhizus MCA 3950]